MFNTKLTSSEKFGGFEPIQPIFYDISVDTFVHLRVSSYSRRLIHTRAILTSFWRRIEQQPPEQLVIHIRQQHLAAIFPTFGDVKSQI